MRKKYLLALALSLPFFYCVWYALFSQYYFLNRVTIQLPVIWKKNGDGQVFGYTMNFGFNPCQITSKVKNVAVCLKPLKKAYLLEGIPDSCQLFIKGFCAHDYFYPRYSQAPTVTNDFSTLSNNQSVWALIKVSPQGFAEVIKLSPEFDIHFDASK